MRDKNYIVNYIRKIQKIWEKYPNIRFGELLANIANAGGLFYLEDNDLLAILSNFYKVNVNDLSEEIAQINKQEDIKNDNIQLSKVNNRKMPDNKNRIYIHNNEGKVKSIFKDDLQNYLDQGWKLGRKDK